MFTPDRTHGFHASEAGLLDGPWANLECQQRRGSQDINVLRCPWMLGFRAGASLVSQRLEQLALNQKPARLSGFE